MPENYTLMDKDGNRYTCTKKEFEQKMSKLKKNESENRKKEMELIAQKKSESTRFLVFNKSYREELDDFERYENENNCINMLYTVANELFYTTKDEQLQQKLHNFQNYLLNYQLELEEPEEPEASRLSGR